MNINLLSYIWVSIMFFFSIGLLLISLKFMLNKLLVFF
jgi:hypothetical protein